MKNIIMLMTVFLSIASSAFAKAGDAELDLLADMLSGQFLGGQVGFNACTIHSSAGRVDIYVENWTTKFPMTQGKPFPYRIRLYRAERQENGTLTVTVKKFRGHPGLHMQGCFKGTAYSISDADLIEYSCEMTFSFDGREFHGNTTPEGCASSMSDTQIHSQVTIGEGYVVLYDEESFPDGHREPFGDGQEVRMERVSYDHDTWVPEQL